MASASAGGAVAAVDVGEEAVALSAGLSEPSDPSEQAASVISRAAVDMSAAVVRMALAPK
ncbi:hypothetical protein AQI94_33395 [Streptomyces pseudovenezuelae]|uniref:Uncharacterized protein n=1 Tax=Streptomyces pseudovenezuelae TaxID=67350 RepID=A0A101N035_9ACTN|nr:hypothetical protein AQI94_33395 [Streptomyces pseudovenezuelae]